MVINTLKNDTRSNEFITSLENHKNQENHRNYTFKSAT